MLVFRFFLFAIGIWTFSLNALLPTYWDYSETELNALRDIKAPVKDITQQSIAKWDDVAYDLTAGSLPDGLATRFFAYLYTAQRDAAYLAYNLHDRFSGTLDPITLKVIALCFPEYKTSLETESDPFSLAVANIVFERVKTRHENEQKNLKMYEPKIGKNYWQEEEAIGQKVGSATPWLVGSVDQFRLPEPPAADSIIWEYGIHQIKNYQDRMNEKGKNTVEYWGSMQGPKSGSWFALANDYMENLSPPLPLKDFLLVRSIYAMSLVDALITVFDNKYTFWVLRPHMLDKNVHRMIDVPRHPSYPSGHSVISATAATVLCYFFPKDADKWRQLAIEAGDSRIAAGLHYMIDNESGLILGEKVGKAALQNRK